MLPVNTSVQTAHDGVAWTTLSYVLPIPGIWKSSQPWLTVHRPQHVCAVPYRKCFCIQSTRISTLWIPITARFTWTCNSGACLSLLLESLNGTCYLMTYNQRKNSVLWVDQNKWSDADSWVTLNMTIISNTAHHLEFYQNTTFQKLDVSVKHKGGKVPSQSGPLETSSIQARSFYQAQLHRLHIRGYSKETCSAIVLGEGVEAVWASTLNPMYLRNEYFIQPKRLASYIQLHDHLWSAIFTSSTEEWI